jgi:hypothetical protein
MKKLVLVATLFAIVSLVMVFAVGTVGADSLHPPDSKPPRTSGGAWLNKVYSEPAGAAARINFEMAGHRARPGLYVIVTREGKELASWYARGGETDSGWISDLTLPYRKVWVEVLYYSGPGANPARMRMLNNLPPKRFSWLARNTAHALEVAWPDEPLMSEVHMAKPN